jgi:hypothetical protein
MKAINIVFEPLLKAVAALANNSGLFKKWKKENFDLKLIFGLTYMPGIIHLTPNN